MAIKSVAIIGAGAAGSIAAAALRAEKYFDRIKVFERRASPGGTWIYDADPGCEKYVPVGRLPPEIDRPLDIPSSLPTTTTPSTKERWRTTSIYDSLTTNVPDIAMSFSDARFPYGPFVPHPVARQYIESYFQLHHCDQLMELNTTLEDLSAIPTDGEGIKEGVHPTTPNRWKLVLRAYDPARHIDIWREETFDAVVLANGHYSVPFIPYVPGLEDHGGYGGRIIMHSKYYRTPLSFKDKRVLVVGNSASGHDVSNECVGSAKSPVYVSRRSKAPWDGDSPPSGIAWKPVITEYLRDGSIEFADGTSLDDIDVVVYCTGYKASFPFWNEKANGSPIWDYEVNKLHDCYWHTFLQTFPTLTAMGVPRAVSWRSLEYQAIAIARLWSERNAFPLPSTAEQRVWEQLRVERCAREHKKFHDILWETGEAQAYLDFLFRFAGLGTFHGEGRVPPALGADIIWAIEHIGKYPDPSRGATPLTPEPLQEWTVVERDSLGSLNLF